MVWVAIAAKTGFSRREPVDNFLAGVRDLSYRSHMENEIPKQTLAAIGDLLAIGKRCRVGITFMPDPEGWTVGYMASMGGGDLASGFDLHTATVAAFRPLLELIDTRG